MNESDSLSIDDESYTDGVDTSIITIEHEANGIEPESYELRGGDIIETVIDTD